VAAYVRTSWRQIRAGDRLKDPRGERQVADISTWGYRLEPDEDHPYEFMRRLPTIGRLKVIKESP
jgi:hypothetical protein